MLLPVALIAGMIVVAFGWRWHTLLREGLTLKRCILVTALGLGANQVLPLRGGDALRVAVTARGTGAPTLHVAISALALEKVFDLVAVATFGVASAAVLLGGAQERVGVNAVGLAVAILLITVVLLAAARFGWLSQEVRRFARWIRMPPRLYRHIYAPLHHLRLASSPGRLGLLLFETVCIWIVLYVLSYLAIAEMLGVSLDIADAVILLFAAAIGLAIPAAPSGIGTFHAAIVSAFVIVGRPSSEGLVLAVGIHAVFFLAFCLIGAFAMPRVIGRRPADLLGRAGS